MTQSLTERLQERLATQSAEIEALTTSELQRLGASLRSESEAALASMRSAMAKSIEGTTRPLLRDLERLRGIGRWWWGTLVLSWATIAMLMALLAWRWVSPETDGLAMYQTFTYAGRTYVMLPEGTEAMTCRQGPRMVPCMSLPGPEIPMGSTTGTATSGTGETPTEGSGGTLTEPPAVRPPARPSGLPSGS